MAQSGLSVNHLPGHCLFSFQVEVSPLLRRVGRNGLLGSPDRDT
jgi:hypothetical protein